MNRYIYTHKYDKPIGLHYIAQAWCTWNSDQVDMAGSKTDAYKKMLDQAKTFAYHQWGANYFDDIKYENWDSASSMRRGGMRIECACYYKS